MIRVFLAGVGVTVAVAAAATAYAADSKPWYWFQGEERWFQGDERAFVAGSVTGGATDLWVRSERDINIGAQHVRFEAKDGNYEFESASHMPVTFLNAYFIGTPTRKPIQVGGWGDGQDLVSLIVGGTAGQESDLQQWRSGKEVRAAIDGKGRLRLGQVVLFAKVHQGRVQLVAELPNGKRQVLAVGRRR